MAKNFCEVVNAAAGGLYKLCFEWLDIMVLKKAWLTLVPVSESIF